MLFSDRHIRHLCRPNLYLDSLTGEMTKRVNPPVVLPGIDGDWNGSGEMSVCIHQYEGPMVEPFCEETRGNKTISYGLTSGGYDLRLDNEIKKFRIDSGEVIDPKRMDDPSYCQRVFEDCHYPDGHRLIIPPGHYFLGKTKEYLRIPRRCEGIVVGKSTLARCLSLVNVTPAEPEWKGHLTLEIGNVGHLPACVYIGEGICQMQFQVLSSSPDRSYADKKGKYQNQQGVTPAIVL
jgi:dCTP deaminase